MTIFRVVIFQISLFHSFLLFRVIRKQCKVIQLKNRIKGEIIDFYFSRILSINVILYNMRLLKKGHLMPKFLQKKFTKFFLHNRSLSLLFWVFVQNQKCWSNLIERPTMRTILKCHFWVTKKRDMLLSKTPNPPCRVPLCRTTVHGLDGN